MLNATPEKDKLCLLGEFGNIENEFHFQLCCPGYDGIKDVLSRQTFSTGDDLFWLDGYENLICFAL